MWPRPGDLVEGDPAEFWRGTVVQAREVLRNADLARVMETPLGRTVADDLSIPVIDLYVPSASMGRPRRLIWRCDESGVLGLGAVAGSAAARE